MLWEKVSHGDAINNWFAAMHKKSGSDWLAIGPAYSDIWMILY